MTVCTSCNIAISVRVGSPGDAGDVAQSIDASTAAAATNVAGTIQAALQTATPLSAPPTPSPMPDIAAAVVAPLVAAAQALTYRIDDGPFIAPLPPVPAPEDLPLFGAPTSLRAAPPPARSRLRTHVARGTAVAVVVASETRIAVFQQQILRRAATHRARARPTAPTPVPPARPPSMPAPAAIDAGIAATHGGGIGVVTALALGLAMTLLYALVTALRLPPAVPPARAARANPHPPG